MVLLSADSLSLIVCGGRRQSCRMHVLCCDDVACRAHAAHMGVCANSTTLQKSSCFGRVTMHGFAPCGVVVPCSQTTVS